MRIKHAALLLGLVALASASPACGRALLVGVARIPSDARDRLGDTLGGFGSGIALQPGTWHVTAKGFEGRLAALPDPGWGASDYRARLQYFDLTLIPQLGHPGTQTGLSLHYRDTLLLKDIGGRATTGLDPAGSRPPSLGMPVLPQGPNGHVSLDGEAVSFAPGGDFWAGDEYGPYIYHFSPAGRMIGAIRPPESIVPLRAGAVNFSAGKGEPQSGRQNNQGFEGVSLVPGGNRLFAMTQSAVLQDLDPKNIKGTRRNVRLLEYELGAAPRLIHEYVVQLPLYGDSGKPSIAAQSEMLALNEHQLLLLCRDSKAGFTTRRDASAYRVISLIETRGASDIRGRWDGRGAAAAPMGLLRPDITPARLTPVLNMNDNSELGRFGLHNGPPNDASDLYEKWEGMALAPARRRGEFYLFVASDNDFTTQHGVMASKPYADASGVNVDTLVLVYRVTLPP